MDRKRNVLVSGTTVALAALVTLGLGNPPVAYATPTIIGACMTIGSAGSYIVDKNLSAAGDHCLVISADDVTIDLAGFALLGDGTPGKSGITDNGTGTIRRNIAIRNGTIQGFADRGIDLLDSRHIKIEEVRIHSNGGGGIRGLAEVIIKDCIVTSNGGVGISGVEAVLTGNVVTGNVGGGIVGSQESTLANNTVSFNLGNGISVGGHSTLTNNTASFNNGNGIVLFIAPFDKCCNTLTSNTASHNVGHGIVASSGGNTFTGNTAGRNGGDGMNVTNFHNTLTGNTASGNFGTGIAVTCPNNLNGNTATSNVVADISTTGPGCRRANNLPAP